MQTKLQNFAFIVFLLYGNAFFAQDVSLYSQFSGRYDFTFFGNTLNTVENGPAAPCTILTSSAADLNLDPGDNILQAYLYWAGSGTGDFDVRLNGQDVSATRNFAWTLASTNRPFFSAFADVTAQVVATGSGTYTLSDLDLTAVIPQYCNNGTNFGGWAVVVIYENAALPLNQINVYDGLQGVPDLLSITLSNLNVIDNAGAKIGFIAWEGDRSLAVAESLTFNGLVVSNPPLNPATNAFNGTNSFTGSTTLYNMDLDVYDIENFIAIGDDEATIALTSGQDFVMINTVVTKLNSQLPDATATLDAVTVSCNTRNIVADYTIYNTASSQVLPALTRLAFYINGVFVASAQTQHDIAIDGSESGMVSITVPDNLAAPFEITVVADDNGMGQGAVVELSETNNASLPVAFNFPELAAPNPLPVLYTCNQGRTRGTFNLSEIVALATNDPADAVSFYETFEDAQSGSNPILDLTDYEADQTPKTLFVRIDNSLCFSTNAFELRVRNCPPTVYNFISANNDGRNDDFFIDGLRDIFINFKLSVYNRWGQLVWVGNNDLPNWNGENNKGAVPINGKAPDGTYFYVLELNDPDYPDVLNGFLYLNR